LSYDAVLLFLLLSALAKFAQTWKARQRGSISVGYGGMIVIFCQKSFHIHQVFFRNSSSKPRKILKGFLDIAGSGHLQEKQQPASITK
jgi:hypothetical protein